MAISTSAPSDGSPEPNTASRHETLLTIAAQIAAIDPLLGLARRRVRVFDIDLSGMGWDTAARAEAIGDFLHADRSARLDIAVHDIGWVERACPRLIRLLKYYGHAMTLRETGDNVVRAMDPMVIVDDEHYLHRFHIAHSRAALGIAEPRAAAPLVVRFDEIWASAKSEASPTVLGL